MSFLLTNVLCCLLGGTIFPCLVESYENIALNKPAWQDDEMFNSSYKAVDGRTSSLSQYGGDCANSDLKNTTEWRVDLEKILSIHHILIQFATDYNVSDENNEVTGTLLGFSVYLSNTTSREDGVLCFRDTNYTRSTMPNPVTIPCPHHGRYVIYYNNRTHPPYPEGYSDTTGSFLCEVEVYGKKAKTQYVLWFGWGAFGTVVLVSAAFLGFKGRLLIFKKIRCLMSQVRNAHIFTEDGCPPQSISIQVMQEHSEDCNSNYNETAYNELFEMTNNYSSLQFCIPNEDNDCDLNTYSYNHLHEKTLYMITDAYAVVKPMLRTPASLDECRV